MDPYVIEATGLTKRYRDLTAVNSIAFSVTNLPFADFENRFLN